MFKKSELYLVIKKSRFAELDNLHIISNSFVAQLGNDNDKNYLPEGYVYVVPNKQKRAEC